MDQDNNTDQDRENPQYRFYNDIGDLSIRSF